MRERGIRKLLWTVVGGVSLIYGYHYLEVGDTIAEKRIESYIEDRYGFTPTVVDAPDGTMSFTHESIYRLADESDKTLRFSVKVMGFPFVRIVENSYTEELALRDYRWTLAKSLNELRLKGYYTYETDPEEAGSYLFFDNGYGSSLQLVVQTDNEIDDKKAILSLIGVLKDSQLPITSVSIIKQESRDVMRDVLFINHIDKISTIEEIEDRLPKDNPDSYPNVSITGADLVSLR